MSKNFDPRFEAYAHYGSAPGPFMTNRVDLRLRPTRHGNYQALVMGRWRRVLQDANHRAYVNMGGGQNPVSIQIVRNDA